MRTLAALTIVVAVTATASGDPLAPTQDAGEGFASFATLDRLSNASTYGVDFSYLVLPGGHSTAIRVEPHAQYTDPSTGIGGYARVPIGGEWGGASGSALGDLEIGALFARSATPEWTIVVHAGIALPTAPTGSFVLHDFMASRVEDLALAIQGGTTLRLGVSPLLHSGRLFVRVDAGVDVNVSNRTAAPDVGAISEDIKPIVHAGVGLGIDARYVVISGELAGAFVSIENGSGTSMTAALAAQFHFRRVQPFAAVVLPMNGGANVFSFALTAGIDASLR